MTRLSTRSLLRSGFLTVFTIVAGLLVPTAAFAVTPPTITAGPSGSVASN